MGKGLEELFAKIPKIKPKSLAKSIRRIYKARIRLAKFSQREGCFVVLTDYTKCLAPACGAVSGMTRLGCPVCRGMNISWGVCINTGKIEKDRMKCAVQEHEFITYKELKKRLISGQRFLDGGQIKPVEITLKSHFKD